MGFPLSGCLLPEISHSLSICGSYMNFVFGILQASKTAGCSSVLAAPWMGPSLSLEAVKNRKFTQCHLLLLSGCSPVPSVLLYFVQNLCYLWKFGPIEATQSLLEADPGTYFLKPCHKCYFYFEIKMPN